MIIPSQLERLKKDHTELEYYIQRLLKEDADNRKIPAIRKRQEYLSNVIQSLEGETLQAMAI